jgi:D-3-phosphoglycerate dehydrogenase
MHISILEPLGVPADALARALEPLRSEGHTVVTHDTRPTSPAQTVERIGEAEIAVFTNLPMPREVIEGAPRLKFLSVAFTGVDHIALDACRERGIAVSNAAGFSTESVAELTVGMVLALLRSVVAGDTAVRAGGTNAGLFGRELNGKTVGVVGTGAIGRRTAAILSAFGVRLLGYNRTEYPEMVSLGMQYLPLDNLLAASDIVTVHLPLTDDTKGLFSRDRIARMKPGARIVNVARGAVIDSAALAEALRSGALAGAAIDVYEHEPPIPADHPLLNAPNVLALPHVAFGTAESFALRVEIVVENILGWASGSQIRVVLPD